MLKNLTTPRSSTTPLKRFSILGELPDMTRKTCKYFAYSDCGLWGSYLFGNEIFVRQMNQVGLAAPFFYASFVSEVKVVSARNPFGTSWCVSIANKRPTLRSANSLFSPAVTSLTLRLPKVSLKLMPTTSESFETNGSTTSSSPLLTVAYSGNQQLGFIQVLQDQHHDYYVQHTSFPLHVSAFLGLFLFIAFQRVRAVQPNPYVTTLKSRYILSLPQGTVDLVTLALATRSAFYLVWFAYFVFHI